MTRDEIEKAILEVVSLCDEGHGPILHWKDKDCPACQQISKRLTNENTLEVKLALAEQKISQLQGTIDALQSRIESGVSF